MSETTIITCPKCKAEIPLTESLAAPIIEEARKDFAAQLEQKDLEISQREEDLRTEAKRLSDAKRSLDDEIAEKVAEGLKDERERISAEEAKKAEFAVEKVVADKDKELEDLQGRLSSLDEKLAVAQEAQAELIKLRRELDDEKREMELTIQTRVQEDLENVREQAQREAETSLMLKVADKDAAIKSMQGTIEELKKKAEQGSQQLQGEVQEVVLEQILRSKFPIDSIEPIGKGEFGGDVLQTVVNSYGQAAGSILWESKRTKNWSNSWLEKLREDQRNAKADVSVLVTQALPKGVDTFDLVDGVWVASLRAVSPIATALRSALIEINQAKQTSEGQQTKIEMVYQYLTGSGFRNRISAIVEAFTNLQSDLDKERNAIRKLWAKRESQIEKAMEATVGMYGDLQGIAGQSLQEIEGLELHELGTGEE